MEKKPTFLVIGAAKSGTTSLCDLLSRHPQVCFSVPKEVRYFSHDENYEKGWSWYLKHFDCQPKHVAIGDGSVHYAMKSHSPLAVDRIAQALPDVKLVYLVRHPLDRILSHYRMYQRSGDAKFLTFEQDLMSGDYFHTLLEPSMYWLQLNAFRNRFSDEQIHIMFLDDLRTNEAQELNRLYTFLGVDQLCAQDLSLKKLNTNTAKEKTWRSRIKDTAKLIAPKRPVQPVAEKKIGKAAWTQRAHQFAAKQIAEDAQQFLAYMEKPNGFWRMDWQAETAGNNRT